MKKRTLVTVALAVVFVLAIAAPAFAQSMTHTASYNIDGEIDLEKQAGHICNTGAEFKQTITGEGKLTKVSDVAMVKGKLTMSDTNDYVTAPDAVRNLTVTSVIELCAPAKYTYDDGEFTGVIHPFEMYGVAPQPRMWYGLGWSLTENDGENFSERVNDDWTAVSTQIWAVQVEANPGFSGNLHQKFEAAYGPYFGGGLFLEDDEPEGSDSDKWGWYEDEDGVISPIMGADYVGNYFNIEQFARTSQGVVKRYVSVSSPWSHGYLMVDSTITGMAEVKEEFSMDNLEAGSDAEDNWWSLF